MHTHSQTSISADSTCMNSTETEKNFFLILEGLKKQNLNLLHTGCYLQSIYIVLGVISNLEMI